MTSFARGMTVFWGTVFTLTLFAIFAPSAYHLLRMAKRHEMASDAPSEVNAWLHEEIYVSMPRQLGNLAGRTRGHPSGAARRCRIAPA